MRTAEQIAEGLLEAVEKNGALAIWHELNEFDNNHKAFSIIFNQLVRNYVDCDVSRYAEKLHQVNQIMVDLAREVGKDISQAKKDEREIWRHEK